MSRKVVRFLIYLFSFLDATLTNSSLTNRWHIGNTNAQGDETNGDAENTENDLSAAAAENLKPTLDNQINADMTDIGEIISEDQNMDRDNNRDGPMHMEEIVREC